MNAIKPDPEVSAAYFEPTDDLLNMTNAAVELAPFPSFRVEFLSVYRMSGEPGSWYERMLDIPLGDLRS